MPGEVIQSQAMPLHSDEIKRRIAEKAALVAELEARNPRPAPMPDLPPTRVLQLTADGRKLAGLANKARRLGMKAAVAAEQARRAQADADIAREALNSYM